VTRQIDDKRIATLRDGLWAQAYAAYLAREQWWLNDAEQRMRVREAERYQVDDPVVEKVQRYLDSRARDGWVTTEELAEEFDLHARKVSRTMQGLGWTRVQRVRGEKKRGFRAPSGWSPPAEPVLPDIKDLLATGPTHVDATADADVVARQESLLESLLDES
jgi:predicted P-loop ATPase